MDSDLPARLGAANDFPAVPALDEGPWRRALRASQAAAFLVRALVADGPAAYRRAFYAFAGVLVTFFALTVLQGPCLQVFAGHDSIIFLASAWRVRNGVLPHADYHSALGALNPWIHAVGMWILGPTASVLPFCNALVAAAFGLLAWTVAARRLPAALAAVFAATQFVVAITPHLLRFPWYTATYDGYYNRQGYALLDTLLLLLFLPRSREPDQRAERRDLLLAGAILGVLLFLKISYFMAGAGLYGWTFALGGRSGKRSLRETALGFGTVFLLCLPLIRFDLAAMLGDLRMAAASRLEVGSSGGFTTEGYYALLLEAWVEIASLALLQSLLRPPLALRRAADGASLLAPSWAEFAGVIGASTFVCIGNSPAGTHSETPLLTSWAFVLLGCLVRMPSRRHRFAPACILTGLLWVYTFGNGFACLCWATSPVRTSWQKRAWQETPAFDSRSLAPLPICDTGGEEDQGNYADKVNDGLRLLRALGGTHRVEAFDFVDPFPFALQWPVARGGQWCWHYGFSFGRTSHPSAEEVFGDIDVVMIPKQPGFGLSYRKLRFLYGSYLMEHYRLESESPHWFLVRRQ